MIVPLGFGTVSELSETWFRAIIRVLA